MSNDDAVRILREVVHQPGYVGPLVVTTHLLPLPSSSLSLPPPSPSLSLSPPSPFPLPLPSSSLSLPPLSPFLPLPSPSLSLSPPSPFSLSFPFSSLSLLPLSPFLLPLPSPSPSPFLLPLPSLTTLVTLYPPSHPSCLTLSYPLSPSLNVHIHYVKCTTDMAHCIMFTLFSVSLYCTCSPTQAVTILGLEHWLHTQPLFALSNLHVCIIRIRPCPLILPVPPVLLYAHASICAPITMITIAAYNLRMKGNCMKNRCTKRQWFWAAFYQPFFWIRSATRLHFVHEIVVPISQSPQCSWWGLVLVKMHFTECVTSRPIFREMCGLLIYIYICEHVSLSWTDHLL